MQYIHVNTYYGILVRQFFAKNFELQWKIFQLEQFEVKENTLAL